MPTPQSGPDFDSGSTSAHKTGTMAEEHHPSNPDPAETLRIEKLLVTTDPEKMKLAKDIALFGYAEERKRTDVVEQRAFNLMQFAKVGLTIIAGIAGLISNASITDTPFRETMIILLAVASAYLAKLFFRGAMVVRVGYHVEPHSDNQIRPNAQDVLKTQTDGDYFSALKKHVAKLVAYMEHTAHCNAARIEQLQLCYVNTFGFLVSFFLFFALSLLHLFKADYTLTLPDHRLIGVGLFALALASDWIAQKCRFAFFGLDSI